MDMDIKITQVDKPLFLSTHEYIVNTYCQTAPQSSYLRKPSYIITFLTHYNVDLFLYVFIVSVFTILKRLRKYNSVYQLNIVHKFIFCLSLVPKIVKVEKKKFREENAEVWRKRKITSRVRSEDGIGCLKCNKKMGKCRTQRSV